MSQSNRSAGNNDLFALLMFVAVVLVGWVPARSGDLVAGFFAALPFALVFASSVWLGPVRGFLVGAGSAIAGVLIGGGSINLDVLINAAVFTGFGVGMLPGLVSDVMGMGLVARNKFSGFVEPLVSVLIAMVAMFGAGWLNTSFLHLGWPWAPFLPVVAFLVVAYFLFRNIGWGDYVGGVIVAAVAAIVFGLIGTFFAAVGGANFMSALGSAGVSGFVNYWSASFFALFLLTAFTGYFRGAGLAR